MRQRQITNILVVMAAVLAVAATAAAGDDRDFMHEVAAAPNIIFILDTSSSMVGSPETADLRLPIEDCDPEELVIDTSDPPDGVADEPDPYGCSNGLKVPFTMVPAGGDDPYSRMGIAKSVLKDFLEDVGEANVAFAGYAQDQPTDGSHPIWKKNWVYEARAQDRFHMVESTYAYRLGYSENHAGVLLDVPADILKTKMIGYKLYFDPESTPLNERFGPTNAYDTGYLDVLAGGAYSPLPYDLLPIYFGNCYIDESDGSTVCMDNIFPFFDGGTWYYGQADESVDDYPGCNPTDAIWDDGFGSPVPGACENEWEEESGVNILQYQRRVRLEIPTTYSGSPNYYLASDGLGGVVGNDEVPDTALNQDYDLDGFGDPDYDGSETSDWILYVNSVEEQQVRTCAPSATLPTWTQTATYTPTFTETFTPTYTPTPIVDCSQITVTDLYNYSGNDWRAKITNQLPYELKITHTKFTWVPYSSSYYVDYFNVGSTGRGVNYTYWGYSDAVKDYGPVTDVDTDLWVDPPDIYSGSYPDLNGVCTGTGCNYANYTNWYAFIWGYSKGSGRFEVCLDFLVIGGDQTTSPASDWLCENICDEDWGALNTPTPTYTFTATEVPTAIVWPTSTPTNTSPPGSSTNTPTNTPWTAPPTSPPLPTATNTPFPPTPTHTPKVATPTPIS